jgi:chromosome segregation ATPase
MSQEMLPLLEGDDNFEYGDDREFFEQLEQEADNDAYDTLAGFRKRHGGRYEKSVKRVGRQRTLGWAMHKYGHSSATVDRYRREYKGEEVYGRLNEKQKERNLSSNLMMKQISENQKSEISLSRDTEELDKSLQEAEEDLDLELDELDEEKPSDQIVLTQKEYEQLKVDSYHAGVQSVATDEYKKKLRQEGHDARQKEIDDLTNQVNAKQKEKDKLQKDLDKATKKEEKDKLQAALAKKQDELEALKENLEEEKALALSRQTRMYYIHQSTDAERMIDDILSRGPSVMDISLFDVNDKQRALRMLQASRSLASYYEELCWRLGVIDRDVRQEDSVQKLFDEPVVVEAG